MIKSKYLTAALLAASTFTASAAVSVIHEYHLGETGSLTGAKNYPVDNKAGANFTGENSGELAVVGTTGVSAPGSTAYVNTTAMTSGAGINLTRGGWWGPDYSTATTDNVAFSIYARAASNEAVGRGNIFSMGGATGAYGIALAANGWAASAGNVAWIGGGSGVTGSFTADQWVHLALIRKGGSTQFYINGVAQGDAYATAPVQGSAHLAINPGGTGRFIGDIDEARIVTFAATDSTADVLNTLQTGVASVPEPSSSALLGLGGLALILHRRK